MAAGDDTFPKFRAWALLFLVVVSPLVLFRSKPSSAEASAGISPPAAPSHAAVEVAETDRPMPANPGRVFSSPTIELPREEADAFDWQVRFPKGVLIGAEDLERLLATRRWRVLDVCPRSQYETRHIPGALWIDYDRWRDAFERDRDSAAWEQAVGALGIDAETPVVVYDSGSGQESANVRAILLYRGIKHVRVLSGGWNAWLFLGGQHESLR